MLWADVRANLDSAISYLNATSNNDIDDATIRREHLVRPVVRGFPIYGSEGEFQLLFGTEYGLQVPERINDTQWASRVDRLPMRPQEHAGEGTTKRIILPIGKPLDLVRASSSVEIACTFEYHHCVQEVGGVILPPFYPDGAGGPASARLAGEFLLGTVNRSTGALSAYSESHQAAYPLALSTSTGNVARHDAFQLYAGLTLAAGRHDVVLIYDVSVVDLTTLYTTWQVEISRVQLSVEVD